MHSQAPAYVDASLFMGMHCRDEAVRIACKSFFVERIGTRLVMPLDQVGLCDDIVWRQPRRIQDLYYPFMDQLHTLLAAERVPYTTADIRRAHEDPRVKNLDGLRALLVARVCNDRSQLYTIDYLLLGRLDLPVRAVTETAERAFPEPIEAAYRISLALRVAANLSSTEPRDLCCAG